MGRARKVLALSCVALVGVAACATPSPAATPSPTAAPTQAGSEPTASADLPGTTSFSFAIAGTPSMQHIAVMAALDDLRSEGYSIEMTELENNSLVSQGVSQGQFQLGMSDVTAALSAAQAGGKVRLLSEGVGDEWMIATTTDITSCEQLEGRSVGVFAVGSFNDVSVRAYVARNCPTTNVEILTMGGSEGRTAAMLAGQLDASPLTIADVVLLLEEAGDRFHVLTNFAETLPDLHPLAVYGNTDFIAENPGTVQELLRAQLNQNRQIAENEEYLASLIREYIPAQDPGIVDTIAAEYVRLGMYDPNGALTEENVNYTIQFYVSAGNIQPGLAVADVADLGPLNAVLDEMGRQ